MIIIDCAVSWIKDSVINVLLGIWIREKRDGGVCLVMYKKNV
jgi:hypothetical protein